MNSQQTSSIQVIEVESAENGPHRGRANSESVCSLLSIATIAEKPLLIEKFGPPSGVVPLRKTK